MTPWLPLLACLVEWPTVLALAAAVAWLVLLFLRGGFWLARTRDATATAANVTWPSVAILVPARNEADVISRTLASLLAQSYPGELRVILVDDQSTDGTAKVAEEAAKNARVPVTVLSAPARSDGWTGKLWALEQAWRELNLSGDTSPFVLLTDADILHPTDSIQRLVGQALAQNLVLTSLMVRLHCSSFAEQTLIPAFVFFFQMLFPFAWVNRRHHKMAAAAGGCILLRRDAFSAAGGFWPIRGALIDDCALARRMKQQGPIWLALSDRVISLRPYATFSEIKEMVARTAFEQLGNRWVILILALAALTLVFLVPPILALLADGPAKTIAAASWIAMALAYAPILRLYRVPWPFAPALPLIAALYMSFTVASAHAYWQGKGGQWKGRAQARTGEST